MAANPGREGRPYRRLRVAVLNRDQWVCQMPVCKGLSYPGWWSRQIPRDVTYPHRLYGTLDHVVALALGGAPLDPASARASHLACNASAGATLGNRMRRPHTSSAPRIAPLDSHP